MTIPTEIYSPGLEGVIAGETAISTVTGGLRYRGYPVVELAEHSTFDEVAHLLLYGELPTRTQLAEFNQRLAAAQKLPAVLSEWLTKLPKNAVPMDVLRTGVSMLAIYDAEVEDSSTPANLRKAERLLAQIPLVIARRRDCRSCRRSRSWASRRICSPCSRGRRRARPMRKRSTCR